MIKRAVYKSNAHNVNRAVAAAARDAVWQAGQMAVTLAMKNVPLDTGTLRRSAIVTEELPPLEEIYEKAKTANQNKTPLPPVSPASAPPGAARAYVSYNTPYAARLHEGVPPWTPRSWTKTPGGKVVQKPAVGVPKWLEYVLPIVRNRMRSIIARSMKKMGV
ncbi:MAG: hypothetical protein LBL26_14705 [Peptococcaceae bacterium]|jgi:hypothetical protein|nr:hypothetical protein [Peptococcaceae bacterium]